MRAKFNVQFVVKKIILLMFCFITFADHTKAQGRNHNWLIGYDVSLFDTNVTSTKAKFLYDSNNLTVIPETRKMPFRATQGNISDENGNLIIVSNGCWIANATGDTMLNGGGLILDNLTSGWCDNTTGLPISHGNVILPFPGDSTKFILIHQQYTGLYYTLIDITLDGGLGGVIQKNISFLQDSISYGFSACKHANGRDWWIIALKDNSNLVYKILLTPDTISSITTHFVTPQLTYGTAGQPVFSSDGSKFAFSCGYGGPNGWHDVRVFNFDRCTGNLDSLTYIYDSSGLGFGLAFSPNSNYLYHSKWNTIYQMDLSTFTQDTVAINDGYYSPFPPLQTDFFLMYLAADGKIYISSGNSVIDMHVINSPDSAGVACDIQQHSIHTPCFFVRSNVLHPNYYLGPVTGSACDSLTGIHDYLEHDFRFIVAPNPSNGNFKISYLLPQNQKGKLDVVDINGRQVYEINLPEWSSMQQVTLSALIADGIYNCRITSGNSGVNKKLVIIRE